MPRRSAVADTRSLFLLKKSLNFSRVADGIKICHKRPGVSSLRAGGTILRHMHQSFRGLAVRAAQNPLGMSEPCNNSLS